VLFLLDIHVSAIPTTHYRIKILYSATVQVTNRQRALKLLYIMLLEKTRELPNVDIRLPDVTPITNVGRVDEALYIIISELFVDWSLELWPNTISLYDSGLSVLLDLYLNINNFNPLITCVNVYFIAQMIKSILTKEKCYEKG
jgi:hypothetical protein